MRKILEQSKELRKLYEESLEILSKDTETTASKVDTFGIGRININVKL